MELARISKLLSEDYGISDPLDSWIRLGDITVITHSMDYRHFVDKDEIYYLSSKNNLLYISKSGKYRDMAELDDALEAYPISFAIDSSYIEGFSSSVEMGPAGTYYTRRFFKPTKAISPGKPDEPTPIDEEWVYRNKALIGDFDAISITGDRNAISFEEKGLAAGN